MSLKDNLTTASLHIGKKHDKEISGQGSPVVFHFIRLLRWRYRAYMALIILAAAVAWWHFGGEHWKRVCHYDFTRPFNASELEFTDVYAKTKARDWPAGPKGLTPRPPEWLWLRNVNVPRAVRLEIEVRYPNTVDGLEVCLMTQKGVISSYAAVPKGYSFQFGGFRGAIDIFSRNDFERKTDSSISVKSSARRNAIQKVAFQILNGIATLEVDGKEVLREVDLMPFEDSASSRIGVRSWCSNLEIRSLSVYRLDKAPTPPTLAELWRVVEAHPSSAEAADALLKIYAVIHANPADFKEERAKFDTFLIRPGINRKIQHRILENECVDAWQGGDMRKALTFLPRIFELSPGNSAVSRLLGVGTPRPLPADIATQLLEWASKTRPLVSLNLRGLGIDSLEPLRNLELKHLDCSLNQIQTLAPLKGMKLESLDCSHNQIDNLDPLRGMPISQLNCADNHISLDPVKELPLLTDLNCAGNHLADLKPLAGLPLMRLDIARNQIESLDPLAGMPLRQFNCSSNRINSLAPLAGASLQKLDCDSNRIDSLAPVDNAALRLVSCNRNPIRDLGKFKKNPPEGLNFDFDSFSAPEIVSLILAWEQLPSTPPALITHMRQMVVLSTLYYFGIDRIQVVYEGRKYALITKLMTWDEADALATRLGGHLAVINSLEENDFLDALSSSANYPWIGLRSENGRLLWTTGAEVKFNAVAGGPEFSDGVFSLHQGRWHWAAPVKSLGSFIVEWPAGAVAP